MIYKAFFGKHIDLSKIISISDAYIACTPGSGRTVVRFEIVYELCDVPFVYERYPTDKEEKQVLKRVHPGSRIDDWEYEDVLRKDSHGKFLAVKNLQKQVDEIIKAWKNSQS